jgi:hypothetical protein
MGFFNPCQHYKMEVEVSDSVCEYNTDYRNIGIPIRYMWDDNYLHLAVRPVDLFGESIRPSVGILLYYGPDGGVYRDHEGLPGIAIQRMLPGIRPKTSAINSVYELKDVTTIGRTMRRLNEGLDALNNLIVNLPTGYRTLRQILKSGSDVYLQNKFNILPLLSDISVVANAMANVQNQLNKLIANAKKPLHAHWGTDLQNLQDIDTSYPIQSAFTPPGLVTLLGHCKYRTRRFQATLDYSYEVESYSPKELLGRGLADYLGLTLSPQVIWNAIPWSFVVDWVLGVGPWLSQFTQRQLGITTHIIQFGWSIKVERETSIHYQPYGRVSHLLEKSYYRTPDNAPLVSSIRSSGLDPTEFSLGGALVLSR